MTYQQQKQRTRKSRYLQLIREMSWSVRLKFRKSEEEENPSVTKNGVNVDKTANSDGCKASEPETLVNYSAQNSALFTAGVGSRCLPSQESHEDRAGYAPRRSR